MANVCVKLSRVIQLLKRLKTEPTGAFSFINLPCDLPLSSTRKLWRRSVVHVAGCNDVLNLQKKGIRVFSAGLER